MAAPVVPRDQDVHFSSLLYNASSSSLSCPHMSLKTPPIIMQWSKKKRSKNLGDGSDYRLFASSSGLTMAGGKQFNGPLNLCVEPLSDLFLEKTSR
ncbi:unnamed protein product [Caenorhabditis auriculariae]|uniref:Uncharacterized protein n=1 Tax=Caenorhabditis auriculariae TaxID=2777116 RepID=A0A8S1HJQ2_9PELO|nr:unnamed protein product [Caenorhabditis auriculariae]